MTCRACIVRRQLLHGLDFRVCLSCTFFPPSFLGLTRAPFFFFSAPLCRRRSKIKERYAAKVEEVGYDELDLPAFQVRIRRP